LNVFVGAGRNGAAWTVPSSVGSFALSIRGSTEACAVWAKAAGPGDVEALFRKIVEGAAGPGVDVSVVKDARDRSRHGTIHTLINRFPGTVTKKNGAESLYPRKTADHPGAPFRVPRRGGRFTPPSWRPRAAPPTALFLFFPAPPPPSTTHATPNTSSTRPAS